MTGRLAHDDPEDLRSLITVHLMQHLDCDIKNSSPRDPSQMRATYQQLWRGEPKVAVSLEQREDQMWLLYSLPWLNISTGSVSPQKTHCGVTISAL